MKELKETAILGVSQTLLTIMIIELTETEFQITFGDKMIDVTETVEATVDIWPYVEQLNKGGVVKDIVYQDELVEYVYRNDT